MTECKDRLSAAAAVKRRAVHGPFIVLLALLFTVIWPAATRAETPEFLAKMPCSQFDRRNDASWRAMIDRNHPIKRTVGDHTFIVPWAYFLTRPAPTQLNCPQKGKGVALQFWIPDLKAPEKSWATRLAGQPAETHRPNPGPDDWIIKVIHIIPFVPDGPDKTLSIEKAVANWRKNVHPGPAVQDGYLQRLGDDYWYRLGERESIDFRCVSNKSGQSLCIATLHLKDWDLVATASYPGDALPQAEIYIDGLRTLLTRWRVSSYGASIFHVPAAKWMLHTAASTGDRPINRSAGV